MCKCFREVRWKLPLLLLLLLWHVSLAKSFRPVRWMTTRYDLSLSSSRAKIYGWDLYGRVPHDDWLFTTKRLAHPDLLKRSFPEMLSDSSSHRATLFEKLGWRKSPDRIYETVNLGMLGVVLYQSHKLYVKYIQKFLDEILSNKESELQFSVDATTRNDKQSLDAGEAEAGEKVSKLDNGQKYYDI